MHSQMEPTFNPFSPDLPVVPHLLAGREEALSQVEAALLATASGKPSHLLIVSEPWLGKTSLALRAERLAQCPQSTICVAPIGREPYMSLREFAQIMVDNAMSILLH